ncbi:MAG: NPCBM/NEW2 domain-containing protein [Clostridia bacterium]|nr:NPCBM/NEW2 domain-containing protein [Clostridia bacterium]
MRIIIRFISGWEGWGTAFAVLLIVCILGSALSGATDAVPYNPLNQLHESSTFDSGVRKVDTFYDKSGNKYAAALMFQYGDPSDRDVYKLDGKYTSFSGTVFVPSSRGNKEDSAPIFIYGDGKRLWASSHMRADSPPEDFCINVSGVNELEIRYDGGAITWKLPIAIGNISIGTDTVSGSAPSELPTRLLDLPMKESTFICRYTHRAVEDHFGNYYEDVVLYYFGSEDDKDVYLLNGEYSYLSGTICIPTERGTSVSDEWGLDKMYYIRIYGDGKLLYTSPQMVGLQEPVDFKIPVDNVKELTVTYYGGASTWNMHIAMTNLLLT